MGIDNRKHDFFIKIAQKTFTKCVFAAFVSVFFLSVIFLFYYKVPLHHDNTRGDTDYVWSPNSFWIMMTEGISIGQYDSQGFNNISAINNPDILLLGSSHMEATEVMQDQNSAFLLTQHFKQQYSVYNKGISGHNFKKICQYLPRNLDMYEKPPQIAILEASGLSISKNDLDEILEKKVKHTTSHTYGLIGFLQNVPFFRLLYYQSTQGILNIFYPSHGTTNTKNISHIYPQSVDIEPYNQLFVYLSSLEKKFGTQIIIVYHPTGKLQKDGSIQFESSEEKDVFQKQQKKTASHSSI